MEEYTYYIKTDLSQYAGKWVGILSDKIVTAGKTFKEVAEIVDEKFPHKRVLIARVPEKKAQLLYQL